MQSDFDDLRFTKADGTTLIDAWLESKVDDTSAVVWIEFPTTPANTVTEDYYMYYGNSGVVSDWDIAATFVFGDDFPGTSVDTSKWTVNSGTWTVSNNELSVTSGGGDLTAIMGSITNAVAEYSIQRITNTGVAEVAGGMQRTFINIRLLSGTKSEIRDDVGAKSTVTFGHSINTWYKMTYQLLGTTATGWIDDVLKHNNIGVALNGSKIGYIHSYASVGKWKDFRVRKYTANPATYAFGSEQSAGNPHWYYNLLKRRN